MHKNYDYPYNDYTILLLNNILPLFCIRFFLFPLEVFFSFHFFFFLNKRNIRKIKK